MAAPVSHIYFAKRFFDISGLEIDQKAFIVGTSFPDIRYLGIIDRTKTHFSEVSLEQVKAEKDPFKAGLLFHNYHDLKRTEYIQQSGLYKLLPDNKFISQAEKFGEDVLLYGLSRDWFMFKDFFREVNSDELSYGLQTQDVEAWHKLISDYISEPPSSLSVGHFCEKLIDGQEMAEQIPELLHIITNNADARQILAGTRAYFEDLFK